MRHLGYILLVVFSVLCIPANAQTPYDSFAPETSRPMLEIEKTKSQTDSIPCVIVTRPLTDDVYKWLSVDPLADKYPNISPYAYCGWNPINAIDSDGRKPVYSTDGELLGTDYTGLQGDAIVMNKDNFTQNMSSEEAMKLDLGTNSLTKEAYQKYYDNYSNLSSRPDWDGIITLKEANNWYSNGGGNPLYANLGELDMSGIVSLGEKYVGQKKCFNLLWTSNSIEAGLVYGQITLKRYPNHQVRAYSDTYNFEMHSWKNPLNWGRNIETIVGSKVAGNGTPYNIHFYGTQTLTPILPWIK